MSLELNCKNCKSTNTEFYKQCDSNGSEHLIHNCLNCGLKRHVSRDTIAAQKMFERSAYKLSKKQIQANRQKEKLKNQQTLF